MNRRRYLAATGSALCIGIAGCSEASNDDPNGEPSGDPPDETPTETPTPDPDPVEGEEMEELYRQALLDRGIVIDHLEATDDRLVMDYETETTTEGDLLREMEDPTFAYAENVTRGWQVELAEIWILDADVDDPQERAIGSYVVENEWAFEWQAEEISDDELMERVVDSIQLTSQFEERYGGEE